MSGLRRNRTVLGSPSRPYPCDYCDWVSKRLHRYYGTHDLPLRHRDLLLPPTVVGSGLAARLSFVQDQNPLGSAEVESHPCAKNAQGWGTLLLPEFWRGQNQALGHPQR